jgi:hypothetical protein
VTDYNHDTNNLTYQNQRIISLYHGSEDIRSPYRTMNLVIHVAIVISAIVLVGTAATVVNYNPAPAHAQQCTGWVFPHSHGQICYPTKQECEAALVAAGGTGQCHRSKG